MIGNDIPSLKEPWSIVHSPIRNRPYAVQTKVGWIISGINTHNWRNVRVKRASIEEIETRQILEDMYIREFQDLHFNKQAYSQEDRMWLNKVQDSCRKLASGNYEISLPFRNNEQDLPETKLMAIKQLNYLKTNLINNNDYFKNYNMFMEDIIRKKHAELVEEENDSKSAWYIPHFGVYEKTED